jgi:hypothetical protein
MSATFQNSAMVLSIGIFFSLIILGLAGTLPAALLHGLTAQGVPHADAARVAALPPVAIMFAALLGYNPVQTLLGHALDKLPASHAAYLTGHTFFPSLIAAPFEHGLAIAFDFAVVACLIAAVASLLRGGKYVHGAESVPAATAGTAATAPAPAAPALAAPALATPALAAPAQPAAAQPVPAAQPAGPAQPAADPATAASGRAAAG